MKILRNVFRSLSNIYDLGFHENSETLKAVNYFYKNASSYKFEWVLITPLRSATL